MFYNMICSVCNGVMKIVKAKIRQHMGCPASCGGKMKEQVVGLKCTKCGIFVSS